MAIVPIVDCAIFARKVEEQGRRAQRGHSRRRMDTIIIICTRRRLRSATEVGSKGHGVRARVATDGGRRFPCSVVPGRALTIQRAGYVPAYQLKKNRLLRSVSAICGGLGIGAGMALRRDFALSMGGFDETFGPGARFPSADEWDIAMRALLSGGHVYETADLSTVHDGFRTFEEGRQHAWRDWLALGAVCAKPLRAGYLRAAVVPAWLFSTRAVLPPIVDLLHFRKPRGAGRIVAFVQGFAVGLGTRVDRATLRFSPP